jgi:hypothetical protein
MSETCENTNKSRGAELLKKWRKVLDYTKSPTVSDDDAHRYLNSKCAILLEGQEQWLNPTKLKALDIDTATPEEYRSFFTHDNNRDSRWPNAGDKVKFLTAEGRFYPHYTNVIANAKANLITGKIYTVRKCEAYSSWCAVWLDEMGEDDFFHLSMFEFPLTDSDVVVE